MFKRLANLFGSSKSNAAERKNVSDVASNEVFNTIVCVPGNWSSWNEFMLTLVEATNGEYIAAGEVMMNVKHKRHYTIEFYERDERMMTSFSYAGLTTGVTEAFLKGIDNHKNVIYITGEAGTMEGAEGVALAVEAVLKTGGIGVKVETAGKAFEGAVWTDILFLPQEGKLYELFVIDSITDENGSVYSCGMQNLGYKDVMVSGEEFQEAVNLIRIFNFYQIVDKPNILSGQTFSIDADAPKFRIVAEQHQPNEDHVFYNPFGMWHLKKA